MTGMPSFWDAIDAGKFIEETGAVADLLNRVPLDPEARLEAARQAGHLVINARAAANRQGVVENFLEEFSLGTREGLALMCLS